MLFRLTGMHAMNNACSLLIVILILSHYVICIEVIISIPSIIYLTVINVTDVNLLM